MSPFCACSTPAGKAGISVIRVSGEDLADILDPMCRIIRTAGDHKTYSQMPGYVCAYSGFVDPVTGKKIDDVIVTRFLPPHSYTGEEMAEISCHGGEAVRKEILRVLYEAGVRPAGPGEFTKTAFINGKLDLAEAEAVMDVINAGSKRALEAAGTQMMGKLSAELDLIEKDLYADLSLIEMIVEFPEHEDTPENSDHVASGCEEASRKLSDLAGSYGKGRLLKERMQVALAGRPNSGKSTLFNFFAGYDRAIVTDIPGTTRDSVEIDTEVDGIPVTVTDTAGIRQTDDTVEAFGVQRARDIASRADLCFILVDPDEEPDEARERIGETVASRDGKRTCVVFTKSDLGINPGREEISKASDCRTFDVSAVTGDGTEQLFDEIKDCYEKSGTDLASGIIIMSERHRGLLSSAADKLSEAASAIKEGLGEDIASSVIRSALEDIGKITGKSVSAELADTIFGRFCIGK